MKQESKLPGIMRSVFSGRLSQLALSSCLLIMMAGATESLRAESKLSDQLKGSWAPDDEAYIELMKARYRVALEVGDTTVDEVADLAKQVAASTLLVFESESLSVMHSDRGSKSRTFKIIAIRKDTKEIDVDFAGKGGEKDEATIVLREGALTLKPRGDSARRRPVLKFSRMSEAEAKKRLATIRKLQAGEKTESETEMTEPDRAP